MFGYLRKKIKKKNKKRTAGSVENDCDITHVVTKYSSIIFTGHITISDHHRLPYRLRSSSPVISLSPIIFTGHTSIAEDHTISNHLTGEVFHHRMYYYLIRSITFFPVHVCKKNSLSSKKRPSIKQLLSSKRQHNLRPFSSHEGLSSPIL